MEKGKILADKATAKANELAKKAEIAAKKKLAEARGEEWKDPEIGNTSIRSETEEEKKYEIATKMKNTWKMKKDPSGNVYYFNRNTSISTFDCPEGMLTKDEYKKLKQVVQKIRENDPPGTWSDDDEENEQFNKKLKYKKVLLIY